VKIDWLAFLLHRRVAHDVERQEYDVFADGVTKAAICAVTVTPIVCKAGVVSGFTTVDETSDRAVTVSGDFYLIGPPDQALDRFL
jgi:hypothetical protein